MKNNFTQALKELTGFDGPVEESAKTSGSTSGFSVNPDGLKTDYYTPSSSEKIFEFSDDDSTHISSTMVINGEIRSNDNIKIDGQVYGNIHTSANLISSSLIIGDITAMNASLLSAHTKGNISLDGQLEVGTGSILIGDVSCDMVRVSGKVKGNLDVRESITLSQSALVSGDIIADSISAEPGTRINGTLSTRSDSVDLDAEFDFGGDF